MKIYGSTQYVDPSKVKEWYQLSVINQWDFITKPICFETLGETTIAYCLHYRTLKEYKEVETITDEMKEELLKQGYTLSDKI